MNGEPQAGAPTSTNSPLVGRAPERALLRELLNAAFDGRGAFLLIGGEAGIGKTTLVADLLSVARERDALSLIGHSYDLTATPPFGPWVELLNGLLESAGGQDLPSGMQVNGDAEAIAGHIRPEAFLETLQVLFSDAAQRRGLVVVLEDLQWADAASLDALRAIARDIANQRLLLIATYRREDVARGAPLYQLMPWLVRESKARRIELRRLNRAATQELAALRYHLTPPDSARLVAYLQRYGEGNPLYIEELLLTLEYQQILEPRGDESWRLGSLSDVQVPPLVRQMIDGRVDRLGPDARVALEVAAIIGQQTPFELWRRVSDFDEVTLLEVLTHAIEANVLEQGRSDEDISFSHALVREALYDAMLAPVRRATHRRVSEALLEQPNPNVDELAYHLHQAGDARMVEWLIRAGQRAERAYAWRDALIQYEAALEQESLVGPTRRQGWLLFRMGAMERFADVTRALAYFDDAHRLAQELDDPVLAAYVAYARGLMRVHSGAALRGLPEMEGGIFALAAMPTADRRRLDAAPGVFNLGALPDLIELQALGDTPAGTEEQIDNLLTGDLDRLGTYAYYVAASGRFSSALTISEEHAQAARNASREPGHLLGHLHQSRAYAFCYLGQPAVAESEFELSRDELRLEAQYVQLFQALIIELEALIWPYHPEQLALPRSLLSDAERVGRLAGAAFPDGFSHQLLLLPSYLRLGRWSEMRALSERAQLVGGQHFLRQTVSDALGWLAYRQGDFTDAWRHFHAVLPRGSYTEPGNDAFSAGCSALQLGANLHAIEGDLESARSALEMLDRWIAWSSSALGCVERELAWAAWERSSGSHERAEGRARQALALAAQPRQPLGLAEAQRILGEIAVERGALDEARAALSAAEELLRRCPCPYELATLRLAQAELQRAGGDRDGAARTARQAHETLTQLNAAPALLRAEALLTATPATSERQSKEFGALTARELDVLRLVAEGLTDAEVADRLYISPRTVGAHMRSIFGKLNVNSRAAAARIAGENRLV